MVMTLRECNDLLAYNRELFGNLRVGAGAGGIEDGLCCVERRAERGRPAAQSVHDRTESRKRAHGCLPSRGYGDAADGAPIEIGSLVFP